MKGNINIMCGLLQSMMIKEFEDKPKRAKGVKTLLFPIDNGVYQVIYVTSDMIFGILMYPDRKRHTSDRYFNIRIKF